MPRILSNLACGAILSLAAALPAEAGLMACDPAFRDGTAVFAGGAPDGVVVAFDTADPLPEAALDAAAASLIERFRGVALQAEAVRYEGGVLLALPNFIADDGSFDPEAVPPPGDPIWAPGRFAIHAVLPGGSYRVDQIDAGAPALPLDPVAVLDNSHVAEASAEIDAGMGWPMVSVTFTEDGARLFGEATRAAVGQELAIVIDDVVVSAPRVNEPILGGAMVLTGDFTVEETEALARAIAKPALPARAVPVDFVEDVCE